MRWPGIEEIYGPHLRTTSVFQTDKRWQDLHTRVIEHVRTTMLVLSVFADCSARTSASCRSTIHVSRSSGSCPSSISTRRRQKRRFRASL
jgi:hypothetical protein